MFFAYNAIDSLPFLKDQWFLLTIGKLSKSLKIVDKVCFPVVQFSHLISIFLNSDTSHVLVN